MSDKDFMLSCQDVSIRYQTGDFKSIGLKEWVVRHLTGNYKVVDFWADRNVTFQLRKGDMLGIIGTNGAGKSTLLKAISGIMEPTKGQIQRKGKIAALLELASGFDGDLTVKENAYLRGAMLGYTREFMDRTYSYIIEFAELKEFEDRPFKQLSSGMKSRLAFSIASLVEPEILILDEVLAVGDGAFKVKSEAKMREIIKGGATTILVSHSLAQIRSMCNKVLWLDKGRQIVFTDDVGGVCDRYEAFLRAPAGTKPKFDPEEIAAKRAAAKAEAERQAAERRRQEEERRRKARASALRPRKARGSPPHPERSQNVNSIAHADISPAFAERNIPVALATDENYLPYLKVTINSAIASSPGSNLDIIVLHAGITEDAILDFTAGYAGVDNASVRFVDISEELEASGLSDYRQTARLPLSSCYRLLLPSILPAYGKIVYIDVDVAVCRDLDELYATDVGDSYFAAAKDVVYNTKPEYVSWAGKWGFEEWDGYVNAGVLVMNLERFRREPVFDRLKEIVFEAAKWNCDQDALNFVCKGAIAPLDPRWNVQLGDYCLEKQIALTGEEMWIAHYTAGQKPWTFPARLYSHLWWRYVDDVGFSVSLWRRAFGIDDATVCPDERKIAVSVIVPIYNAETYLVQMLVSLAAQTLRNSEVICIDDGSTDGSGAICERFASADARFKILHQTNSGAAVARNRGIGEAQGRWLFFADADDFCRPDMLADMVADGERKGIDIVVAGRSILDSQYPGRVYESKVPVRYLTLGGYVDCRTEGVNVFSGLGDAPWNKLYRREFILARGLLFHQTPSCDDVYFVLVAFILAARIGFLEQCYYFYRANLPTSQIGQVDKHPTNFLVALLEVRDIVATQEAKIQQDFFPVAVRSCFSNLVMRKTPEGTAAAYAAIRDGGLEALRLPFADETCVDIGACRKAFALALAKADILNVLSVYCREQQLSMSAAIHMRDREIAKLRIWLAEKRSGQVPVAKSLGVQCQVRDVTILPSTHQYNYAVFEDGLETNGLYKATAKSVELTSAALDKVTMAILDKKTGKVIKRATMPMASVEWIVDVPGDNHGYSLLLYAGEMGKTAGVGAVWHDVELLRIK